MRELQPTAIVNERMGIPGDFVTPEQYQPLAPMVRDGRRGAVGGLPRGQLDRRATGILHEVCR